MIEQDEVDSEKFVFLLDVSNVGTTCAHKRKSAINSHAAKRMHEKRRQKQKQRLRQGGSPTTISQGLDEVEHSEGDKTPLEPPDSFSAGGSNESQTLNLSNVLTAFRSTIPHRPISMLPRTNLAASTASSSSSSSSSNCYQDSNSSTGSSPSIQKVELGLLDKNARQENQDARPTYRDPRIPLLPAVRVEVWTGFNEHVKNYLRCEETFLSKSLLEPVQAWITGATNEYVPLCRLGSGRQDPFTVYPLTSSRENHKLLHFFHNEVAEIVFGYGPAAPLCYLRLVTQHFMHDEAIMNLILAWSSYAWSSLFGKDETYEKKGLIYMTKGVQIVNRRLRETDQPVSESAIQAAILMSAIEGRAGNIESFKTHVLGARQMVKLLGGLDRLSPLLLWQICSLLYARSEPRVFEPAGVEMFPCTDRHFGAFLLQYRPDIAMHHAAFKRSPLTLQEAVEEILDFFEPLDLPPSLYLSGCVTEFLIVTGQFRDLSGARNEYLFDQGGQSRLTYTSAQCLSVSTALCSPLASILNPGRTLENFHTISQNATAVALYKHETTRMVCLFHIHTMLWRYRNNPTQTDAYMQGIVREVQRNGLAFSKSLDALNWVLVWLCLSDNNLELGKNEMGWKELTRMVLRLMRVALRLSRRSWRSLEYAMFEGLIGQQRPRGEGEVEPVHDSATSQEAHIWPEHEVVWSDFMDQSTPPSGRYK